MIFGRTSHDVWTILDLDKHRLISQTHGIGGFQDAITSDSLPRVTTEGRQRAASAKSQLREIYLSSSNTPIWKYLPIRIGSGMEQLRVLERRNDGTRVVSLAFVARVWRTLFTMSGVNLFTISEQEKQEFLKIAAALSEDGELRSGYVFHL